MDSTDITFQEEQRHLSQTYATIVALRDDLVEELEVRQAQAAQDLKSMSEELRPDVAGVEADEAMETLAAIETLNSVIDASNQRRDFAMERMQRVLALLRQPYFAKVRLKMRPGRPARDIYIGAVGLTDKNRVPLVVDWRSPVAETYYKQVYKGMPVDIALDAYEGETFYGKVTIVYPTVDQTTHTFPVEVTITNSEQKVRPGMFARATVNFGDQTHVVVPDEALVKQIGAGDRYVYVYKDGKVSYNKVELGKHLGDKYEILSGVNPGDDVVIAGQSRLANGKEVEVVK